MNAPSALDTRRVRRKRPLAESTSLAALRLRRAESSIALLDRVRPLNLQAEQARLLAAFEAGTRPEPVFAYAPPVELSELRRDLASLASDLDEGELEDRLLGERARELSLEAELAEHVGQEGFASLAARRFALPAESEALRGLAQQLLAAPPFAMASGSQGESPAAPPSPSELHVADDRRDPESLWCELERLIGRGRLPLRIEATQGLVSLAAVADGVVRLRAGAQLSAAAARRIALHEVLGHARPRFEGQTLGGVFAAASARASEDEEGRAMLLEERAGLLDAERRRQLAQRFFAADSVRAGAGFWDTFTLLGRHGATASAAIELSCRVHRGGGLGRELIYLSGYARVSQALAKRPELEALQCSGRVSLAAAEMLFDSVELDDDGDVI